MLKIFKYQRFKQFVLKGVQLELTRVMFLTCLLMGFLPSFGLAADKKPNINQKIPANSLDLQKNDPLLSNFVNRPLTPGESIQLKASLDQLATQADTKLKSGEIFAAFQIWNRELRLRQVLGKLVEVEALGRVGAMAWQYNQKDEIEIIGKRLEKIKKETFGNQSQKQRNISDDLPLSADKIALLPVLAQTYEKLRSPQLALEVYQQILAVARQQQNAAKEELTLKTIAAMQMSWFDYLKAAETYEELVVFAQKQGDYFNQANYLQELAYIYEQAKKPENSLLIKQRLAESYVNKNDLVKLPALKIAIAADYEALYKLEDASKSYQDAYSLAISLQQFAYASEALEKLAFLYKNQHELDYALQVYQVKLKVDQQSYSYYGLMNSYDQMGQIYVEQKKYPEALEAFKKGLELAKSLQYQEKYFITQIEKLNTP